jgi:hypothetical protein
MISSNISYNAQQPKQLETGGTRKKREREKENKKGSFTYSWTRRHGQNPRQAFEFTCTCSSSDNERDQRNIPIHTGRQKRKCGTFSVDNQNNAYCSCITAANSEASSCWLLPHMLVHVILWEAQMWSLTNQSEYRVGSEDGLTSTMANQSY